MYLLYLQIVMAKSIISTILFLVLSVCCRGAANDVSKEFHRLRNLDNQTLIDRGYRSIVQCKYDSAMIYYSMVVNRYYSNSYEKKQLPDIVKAMQNLGIIYMTYSYDYKKSYDYLLQARDVAEQNHIYENLPNIYNCIANILQLSMDENKPNSVAEVFDTLRKSFRLAVKLNDHGTLAIVMDNFVTLGFGKKGKLYDIRQEIRTFRKVSRTMNSDATQRQALLMCRAYDAFAAGNGSEAIAALEQSIQADDDNPFAYRGILSAQGLITKVYTSNRQYDKAIESINKSLDIAKRNNSLDFIPDLYFDLSKAYASKDNTSMASKYELEYHRAKEKLLDEGQLSSVKSVEFIHELNKANAQVRELSEKRRTQSIMLCVAFCVLCVIVVLLCRIYRDNRKIRQNYKYIYRSNVELLDREARVRSLREESERKIAELEKRLDGALAAPQQETAADGSDGQQPQKYQSSRLTDDEAKDLYASILKIMENSDEIFKSGFGVERLGELVGYRPRYVSQTINQEFGSNFNSLLNEYRIREACRRLNDKEQYANMTIEGIAESVGFKSRTSFGKIFKNITGLSPSAYQHMAREE